MISKSTSILGVLFFDVRHWMVDIGHWMVDIGHWTVDQVETRNFAAN